MTNEMREPTFLVLAALADEPRHGYAVQQEVNAIAGGAGELRTSTVYAALDRLRSEGLICEARRETVDGRLRRYYELTVVGRQVLETEIERLSARAHEAKRRLSLRAVTA